ncbi:hypothetical protein [Mangrovimonas aestuarii]|uniref:hypothetical protein n=1 Tax=Mangrovimonas aestuarii TaxID=3018443 RepID=UPI00237856B9|nr:hypothetical protein [Mangrovimonas aestuarii]
MDNDSHSKNFDQIKIDNRITLKFLDKTLFYKELNYSDNLEEIAIPFESIKEIKFEDKQVDLKKTKSNIIKNLFFTLLNSGAYPTDFAIKNPKIIIRYTENTDPRWKRLVISNRLITSEIFDKIKSKIPGTIESQ